MMAAELRSPHERRSDHLSILTRRPPPPPTPGRFSKTFTDAPCVGTFDPAFDSDADTDGPASGSSVWRRDFNKVLSASSGMASNEGIDFTNPQTDLDTILKTTSGKTLAQVRQNGKQEEEKETLQKDVQTSKPPSKPHGPSVTTDQSPHVFLPTSDATATSAVPPPMTSTDGPNAMSSSLFGDRTLSDEQTPPVCTFSRDRACSFYGRGHEGEGEEEQSADTLGPMSREQLQAVLDDDYELFYEKGEGKMMGKRGGVLKDVASEDGSPSKSDSTVPDSPEMKDKELGSGVGIGKKNFNKKMRSFRLFGFEERMTVSLVSGSESELDEDGKVVGNEDLDMTGRELNELLAGALERPRASSGAVPLFVEEAGRIPRAAIVDGRMQRVRVRKGGKKKGKQGRQKSFVERVFVGCMSKAFEEDVRKRAKRRSQGSRKKRRRSSRWGRRSFAKGRKRDLWG